MLQQIAKQKFVNFHGLKPALSFLGLSLILLPLVYFLPISTLLKLICFIGISTALIFFLFHKICANHCLQNSFRKQSKLDKQQLFLLTPGGEIVFASSSAAEKCNSHPTKVEGLYFWEYCLWSHIPELTKKLEKEIATAAKGQQINGSMAFLDNRGKVTHLDYAIEPVKNKKGKIIQLLVDAVDVSEIKELQADLAQKNRQQDIILNSLPMSFYSYKPKEDNKGLWLSEQIYNITGFTADYFKEDYDRWKKQLHPADAPRVIAAKEQISDSGSYRLEYQWQIKDGSYRWYRDEAIYIEGEDDHPSEVVGICIDITEEKKGLERLHLTNSFIVNNPFGIICFTLDKRCVFANDSASKLFGYTNMELLTLSPEIFFDSPQSWIEKVEKIRLRDTVVEEWQLIKNSGESFPADISATYIDIYGVEYIFCGIRDISGQKEMEKELIQAQKLDSMSTLAAGLAHDYNNILSAIFGYTQLARMNFDNHDKQEKALSGIYKATSRAKELVQQILTFSRKSRNEKSLMRISVLAKEVMKFLRQSIPAHIEMDIRVESESMVLMNPAEIHQVYVNLCINAAESMKESTGVLTSKLYDITLDSQDTSDENSMAAGNYVCIEIGDTGEGMAEEVLKRVYDPYFSTQEKAEGRGLGLAVVYGIITDHGGYLNVNSTPDEGTTFKAYLPCHERDKTDEKEPETDPSKLRGYEHVLFVDDDAAIVNVTSRVLQRNGYKVTTCMDGKEALDHFMENEQDFDIVVTDMTMPRLSGDKLAKAIMTQRPELPVIICTGHRDNIETSTIKEAGVKTIIEKPYHIKNLIMEMRKNLDGVSEDE